MADDQQETIQDLFRLMNDMRGEMKGNFDQVRSELRATKRELGLEIDALSARVTALTATVDGLAARHRDMGDKFDQLSDQVRAVIDRLDRAHVPAD